MRRVLPGTLILLVLPAMALAQEAFPPPEFTTGYQFPETTTPSPREQVFSYVDIGVLVLALSLAAYLTLSKRSRRDLVVLIIFCLLYFGFYRKGCICAVGAIQNVALAAGNPDYRLPLTAAAFFALPLVFALFFGRVFCAAAWHGPGRHGRSAEEPRWRSRPFCCWWHSSCPARGPCSYPWWA